MNSVSAQQQWPRSHKNELHKAAFGGSHERVVALLSEGSIDINQGDPQGWTPLVIASGNGHSRAVMILLSKGANVSIAADGGVAALHLSATRGHLAISKMLVNAGADVDAAATDGATALHLAAEFGHSEVMRMLIEAGANRDSRCWDGTTPLYFAAHNGHVGAIIVLLRAKANLLLTRTDESGRTYVPLDIAVHHGHLEVVRELVQQVGIEGCGGASGGEQALLQAARNQHLDVLAVLTDAGVVDNGRALIHAATHGRELSVKSLLQQRKDAAAAYVNYRDTLGRTALLGAMGFGEFSSPSPRVVRLLIDAGVDTKSTARVTDDEGEVVINGAPLALASLMLREKKIAGKDITEEKLHRVEGVRRLLLRVEAVHAVSFLWPVDVPSISATAEGTNKTVAASTSLRMMLAILRRRARRPRVLLAALFRHSQREL